MHRTSRAKSSPKKNRRREYAEALGKVLSLKSRCRLRAQRGEGKPDSFILQCNTGKPMDLGGFAYPVVVDLRGSRFDKQTTPVLIDHRTSLRMGHTTEQVIVPFGRRATFRGETIHGPMIAATGVRSSKMRVARDVIADMRGKFPFQVSIGARVIKAYFVDEGETAGVNGKVWEGPLIVASETLIREVSITVLGADSETSANIAAAQARNKESKMKFTAYLGSLGLKASTLDKETRMTLRKTWERNEAKAKADLKKRLKARAVRASVGDPLDDGMDDDDDDEPVGTGEPRRRTSIPTVDDLNATAADNESRIDNIRELASQFADCKITIKAKEKDDKGKTVTVDKELSMTEFKAYAIRKKMSAEEFELECRRAEYPVATGGPAIHSKDREISSSDALVASILRYDGRTPGLDTNKLTGKKYGLEAMFGEKVLEESHRPQYDIHSISELMAAYIRSCGKYPGSIRGADLLAEAYHCHAEIKASGFSTLSLTNILENVMNKASQASWGAQENIWPFITGRRPLNDFRAHVMYRLDFSGAVKKVAPDGELKHISMVDLKKTIQAETYGAMISVDRKTMIDDDLGMVLEKARGITVLVAQRMEESIFVLLLSNPSSFFAAGNNNLATGGGSALSITSLETARQGFRNQVVNGKPVSNSPRILLAGTGLETTANRLWAEEKLAATGNTDDLVFFNNPHKGLYRPYYSPYLNNTGITDQDGLAITGQSATQWYLFSDPNAPQGSALVIGFLNGRDTPFFDSADTQFNIPGGIQMRCFLDWGVAMHHVETAYKSAGA